ncbi:MULTISPECIES: DUF3944 domain-containing protein [unclassified Campylobacter]|uniref:DUF3944 domain-containing protein n=1 Tax=unclassified Campylobacter TaxID=2593542 RepID=UPI003D34940E
MSKLYDADLDFLRQISDEDLTPLVKILTDPISETLTAKEKYKAFNPQHSKYIDEIIDELHDYGGNTVFNLLRGSGVSYREILLDVCKNLKMQNAKYLKSLPIDEIEQALIEQGLRVQLDKLDDAQKIAFLNDLGIETRDATKISTDSAILMVRQAFRAGGFKSYQISLKVINYVWNATFGIIFGKLSFATNALITKSLKFLTSGPIAGAMAVWTIFDIASPAYRVTTPAVYYIASLRLRYKYEKLLEKENNK